MYFVAYSNYKKLSVYICEGENNPQNPSILPRRDPPPLRVLKFLDPPLVHLIRVAYA